MAPKPTQVSAPIEPNKRSKARGADRRTRYPGKMKLKAIEMMEKGEDRKEVEKKLYKEFKISVRNSTLSDWWVGRGMLKGKLATDGEEKAVQHPRWPELDSQLLPLLQPLEDRGVLTVEIIRKQVRVRWGRTNNTGQGKDTHVV